jgi:hypothetical protein
MKQLVSEIKRHYQGEIKFQSEIWTGWSDGKSRTMDPSVSRLNETSGTDADMAAQECFSMKSQKGYEHQQQA